MFRWMPDLICFICSNRNIKAIIYSFPSHPRLSICPPPSNPDVNINLTFDEGLSAIFSDQGTSKTLWPLTQSHQEFRLLLAVVWARECLCMRHQPQIKLWDTNLDWIHLLCPHRCCQGEQCSSCAVKRAAVSARLLSMPPYGVVEVQYCASSDCVPLAGFLIFL